MIIKKFTKKDAIKVSKLIKKTLTAINKKEYSKETIAALVTYNQPKKLIERSKTTKLFIAVEDNNILGVGGYEDDYLQCFFVDPKTHGKGIGKKIIKNVIKEMKKEGYKKIYCNSTKHAIIFYEKHGFKIIKEETSSFMNSYITYTKMVYRL